MKVGVLGSGDVAKALAAGFVAHGHEVMVGSRTPAKLKDWAKDQPKALPGSFAEAARFGELLCWQSRERRRWRRFAPQGRRIWPLNR